MVTDGSDSGDGSDITVAVVVTAVVMVVTHTSHHGQEVTGFTSFICSVTFYFSVYLNLSMWLIRFFIHITSVLLLKVTQSAVHSRHLPTSLSLCARDRTYLWYALLCQYSIWSSGSHIIPSHLIFVTYTAPLPSQHYIYANKLAWLVWLHNPSQCFHDTRYNHDPEFETSWQRWTRICLSFIWL